MTKDKYRHEYFKHRNQLLPIRWMAPECFDDEDEYSIKSDVYSYGILIWEIFTQAVKIPHDELTNESFMEAMKLKKLEWHVGDGTPIELKNIFLSCLNDNPKERPSFSQLITAITNCLQSEYPKEDSTMVVGDAATASEITNESSIPLVEES